MNKKILSPIDNAELETRISLNYNRLESGDYYGIEKVFARKDYDWYGDKEGRALLAFVSHYRISGAKIPCMELMLEQMPDRLNSDGYFGPIYENEIHEQQLSGHSWLLRGLCEHYEAFSDSFSLETAVRITENLYLTKKGCFSSYPINREEKKEGGVSGSEVGTIDGWILSSDIGCAFMSVDGLSHVYAVTKDARVRELLDEMIFVYLGIDKVTLKAQTHCTLTAARGMMRMYKETADEKYLDGARSIMELYAFGGGMTETYQNLNWWGRPDSWTEPCAIVDSLMLAGELYKATSEEKYRAIAARVYHNGLAAAQRENGGAGTDSIVLDGTDDFLYSKMFEAYFCCTMRLAEGLRYINENKDIFAAMTEGEVTKKGRIYSDGDILYAEVSGGAERYAEKFVTVDGHNLCPIVKYYKVPAEVMKESKQRILF
ncbi:MAG: hypothetical protein E7607_02710 [Ruminococcaceae bacterium]|nr:hypothetical protein [Oscillospiraceae bacterium]